MNSIFLFFIAFGILFQPSNTKEASISNDLQQITGTWKGSMKSRTIYEQWKKISDHELSGFSYGLKGNDTIIFERTRILEQSGETNYLATVTGHNEGKEVAFHMISSANKTFVFENKAHDFPQRVIYQFINSDSLHAWIEGDKQGKFSKEEFSYSRVTR